MCVYILVAAIILYLTLFIKEGFNAYHPELRPNYYPVQSGNLSDAGKCIQNIINSGVTQKQGEYLDDLLNLLQFI
jgi:hypothetical protein